VPGLGADVRFLAAQKAPISQFLRWTWGWLAKFDHLPNTPALPYSVWFRGMPFLAILLKKNSFFSPSFTFIDLHPASLSFIGLEPPDLNAGVME
jgi:hypothetical protein